MSETGEVLVCPRCGSDATGTLEDATIWQRATFTAVPDGEGEVETVDGIEATVEWGSYSEDVGDTETVGWFCRGCLTTWRIDGTHPDNPLAVVHECPFVLASEVEDPDPTQEDESVDPERRVPDPSAVLDGIHATVLKNESAADQLQGIYELLELTGRKVP